MGAIHQSLYWRYSLATNPRPLQFTVNTVVFALTQQLMDGLR